MGYEFDWGLPFRQPYLGWLLSGLALTAFLTVVSSVGSLLVGVLGACGKLSSSPVARGLSTAWIEVFRNIPTLFWVLFFCFVAPTLAGEHLQGVLNRWSGLPLLAACLALILSNAAHVAEILRSGIQSVSGEQRAAALSLGLHPLRAWWSVILPQALHVSLPALGPRMVHNFHNTSLALVISVPEVTWQTQQIESYTFRGFEAVTIASLIFITISLALTLGFRLLERRARRWNPSLA